MNNSTKQLIAKKIEAAIDLLKSIDDDLDNKICLVAPEDEDGEIFTALTYWGVAEIVLEHLKELESEINE